MTICFFAGAKLLAPPRHLVLGSNTPPILAGLGVVLAFLLLNIEIADFFSAPGSTLTFEFGGNFAREMTYTISWALFALLLLVMGIWKKIPAARYAAMGLLCVTLMKLFFHDLAQLGQLYRIGAFVGVAVIAMLASFAYQNFSRPMERRNRSKMKRRCERPDFTTGKNPPICTGENATANPPRLLPRPVLVTAQAEVATDRRAGNQTCARPANCPDHFLDHRRGDLAAHGRGRGWRMGIFSRQNAGTTGETSLVCQPVFLGAGLAARCRCFVKDTAGTVIAGDFEKTFRRRGNHRA